MLAPRSGVGAGAGAAEWVEWVEWAEHGLAVVEPSSIALLLSPATLPGSTQGLSSTSARQMLGLWDKEGSTGGAANAANADNVTKTPNTPAAAAAAATAGGGGGGGGGGGAPAVYFAAHDPAHIVKTCAVNAGKGALSCSMLAKDGTLPLHAYTPGWWVATITQ